MDIKELTHLIDNVTIWRKGEQRAPHKPLLLLYALSRYKQGHERLFAYDSEIKAPLLDLLHSFGPQRKTQYPNMPFWRLQGDGFWQLINAQDCINPNNTNKEPSCKRLAENHVQGGFSQEAYGLLNNQPKIIDQLAQRLLDKHFPESVQEVIANRLDFSLTEINKQRDPKFRQLVLRAYNYQCAICGYNLRHDCIPVGLEAAHVKWKQSGGPCIINNGIALCSLHHSAFDIGAIGLNSELKLLVSSGVNGNDMVNQLFWQFAGNQILLPKAKQDYLHDRFVEWHLREVFRG